MATKKRTRASRTAKPSVGASASGKPSEPAGHGEGHIPPTNGTELLLADSAAPNTHIHLNVGVSDLVKVLTVHAKQRLRPQLEAKVAEINQLGNEIQTKGVELNALFVNAEVDPELTKRCEVLLEVAAQLNIRLSYEVTKVNFSPETLKYTINIQFRGDMRSSHVAGIDSNDEAIELRDGIAELHAAQHVLRREAKDLSEQLKPENLDENMHYVVTKNELYQTELGTTKLDANLAAVDGLIDKALGLKQLTKS
jgi:hypothetical protein